jgi:hypothetical protein
MEAFSEDGQFQGCYVNPGSLEYNIGMLHEKLIAIRLVEKFFTLDLLKINGNYIHHLH